MRLSPDLAARIVAAAEGTPPAKVRRRRVPAKLAAPSLAVEVVVPVVTRSEATFQRQVIDLAHMFHWRVASFRAVRVQRANGKAYYATPVGADGAGWPDLTLVRPDEFIVAELKVPPNKPTPQQHAWLNAIEAAGISAYVWTPADWLEIEKRLKNRE